MSIRKWMAGIAAPLGALTLLAQPASAINIEISGFVRQEVAVGYTDRLNPATQHGHAFNDWVVRRAITRGLIPGVQLGQTVGDIGLGALTGPVAGILDTVATAAGLNVVDALPLQQDVTRNVKTRDNTFNLVATRAEIDVGLSLTSWMSASFKLRAFADWDIYDQFGSPKHMNEGEFFQHGNGRLEYADRTFMVDFPAAYLEIFTGPFWARIGNQQIAWGEALFYRVFDVANGLDTRRHLILDYAQEEYADERRSAPGIRMSYRLLDNYEIEVFAQMAAPTIFPASSVPVARRSGSLLVSGYGQNRNEQTPLISTPHFLARFPIAFRSASLASGEMSPSRL